MLVAAYAFLALFALQVVGTLAYFVIVAKLLRRLRSDHPAVFESLGSPSLIANNTPKNSMLFLRWLWRRDYTDLGNPGTVSAASTVRIMLVALLFNLVALIVLFAVFGASIRGQAV